MPFDHSSVEGYIGICAIHLIISTTYVIVTILIESLFLAMGLYLRAFHLHFKSMLQHISDLAEIRRAAIDPAVQLKSHLIEAIRFHDQAKE